MLRLPLFTVVRCDCQSVCAALKCIVCSPTHAVCVFVCARVCFIVCVCVCVRVCV
jgi:hypothetical protein